MPSYHIPNNSISLISHYVDYHPIKYAFDILGFEYPIIQYPISHVYIYIHTINIPINILFISYSYPINIPLYIHMFGTRGMSAHTDRLLRLMVENGVTNTAVLERLNAVRWGRQSYRRSHLSSVQNVG